MSLLCLFDASCLSLLLFCAIDIIRQTNPLRHPFHALGFVAMAIGASGWILQDMAGITPSWYAVMFHAGLAIYSALGAYALWFHKKDREDVERDSEPVGRTVRAAVESVSGPTGQQGRYPKS